MNDEELLNLIKNEYKRIKPNNCWEFFKQRDNGEKNSYSSYSLGSIRKGNMRKSTIVMELC